MEANGYEVHLVTQTEHADPTQRITGLMGPGWHFTVEQVVHLIESGQGRFFTRGGGRIAYLVVATSATGRKYVKTQPDAIVPDNLSALKPK